MLCSEYIRYYTHRECIRSTCGDDDSVTLDIKSKRGYGESTEVYPSALGNTSRSAYDREMHAKVSRIPIMIVFQLGLYTSAMKVDLLVRTY